MSMTPMWQREPHSGEGHGDLWDCLACSIYLEEPPPRPQGSSLAQPDTRPRLWAPKGELDPSEDPCGRPPTFREGAGQ